MPLISYISIPVPSKRGEALHYMKVDLNTNYLYFKHNGDYKLVDDLYQYACDSANVNHPTETEACCEGCMDCCDALDPEELLEMCHDELATLTRTLNLTSEQSQRKRELEQLIQNFEQILHDQLPSDSDSE